MNYRHAFHAGNFADVLKHAVLARILAYLGRKDAGYRVIDSHAGIGLYDLAADEALRTGEWRGGVGRVRAARPSPALGDWLAPWLSALRAVNGGDDLLVYPGSPAIATALGRLQDRYHFNELHPQDAATLTALYAGDRRVRVGSEDGYVTVRAQLPPRERRGLVIVDPPFEEAGEFDRLTRAVHDARKRFATGCLMIWYPIKDVAAVDAFLAGAAGAGYPRLIAIEQWVRQPGGDGPLAGAGVLVANPPFTLADETEAILPELTRLLAEDDGAGGRVLRLAEDG
ncbi:23S rRNA (adenine(2030)-N(6))-methyltransferase RlmJ [Pleomorphomonas carboxyditropha]|uniref:Ribosomal RNA large subunit methyltransferase J n=1 Tax=Pleomorphomonas carboxyditropha TaxID=2023338 RepID=A0A2G9WR48_9HYPH|nr:23S rRNA (adenine(2030)-N(6))-methyltransferase RlmJ [Pleomorphomonas carboxyditropha]PIO97153.1 23S rRNA (adenine(2030)-N(6))-methyltransferase RlmJ [Pleomorphomonas carboxyditropha]